MDPKRHCLNNSPYCNIVQVLECWLRIMLPWNNLIQDILLRFLYTVSYTVFYIYYIGIGIYIQCPSKFEGFTFFTKIPNLYFRPCELNKDMIINILLFYLQLFTIYEEHLRQSSVVVAEEQNQLSRKIKHADQTVSQILGLLK